MSPKRHQIKQTAFVTFSSRALKERPRFFESLIKSIEKDSNYLISYKWFESKERRTSKEIYEKSLASIRAADICIAEASLNSIGVGQQIAYALQIKKPTIICIDTTIIKNTSSGFLKGTNASNVFFVYYTDLKDLQKKLVNIVTLVDNLAMEKFNFLANKKQKAFLLEESKKRNISKSELLRLIVDEWMDRNTLS